MALPQPADLTSLVVRTDFSDGTAWDALRSALDSADVYPHATYVDDPAYAGVSVGALVAAEAVTIDDDRAGHLFLADATTMADGEHPLLAVDLYAEPGRTFRLPPRWFPDVSVNLALANMDFADFADATDGSGTFRGFGD